MKLNKLFLKIGLCCSVLLFFAFIPKGDDPVDKLVAALQKWTDTSPQEKVYLHMDKPYYALGDTIWFKGYVTVGSRHQLSALSGALYVDLITDRDSLVKTLKLPITTGMVEGDFILDDDLRQGNYRVRAYTQWMRNAGPDYFFDKTFTVGDLAGNDIVSKVNYQYKGTENKPVLIALLNYTTQDGKALAGRDVHYDIVINNKSVYTRTEKTNALGTLQVTVENDHHVDLNGSYIRTIITGDDKQPVTRDFPLKAALSQSDIQFFPESGNLINGVSSHVGFKAVGIDGLGVAVKGTVVDEAGNEVATIETLHAGMGSFSLRPEAGKSYSAKISFPDGSNKTFALPKAIDDGFVLSVAQPNKDSILVRIGASANQVTQAPTLSFIAQTSGEVIVASPVKIGRASTSIWLEKKLFPTGITQFTIFNAAGEPLNERVAFVKSNDIMKLDVKSPKNSYNSKEPIKIDLEAKDSKGKGAFGGNFSVSVIDETKLPINENDVTTIFSSILLSSDLKGYIEKPNYYFANEGEDVEKALDNLMLTQGYRRFTWKEIINPANKNPIFPAEPLTATISGSVTTLGNKILPNANVSLLSMRGNLAETATTDATGHFKFDKIFLRDSLKVTVQARTAKNSDHAILTLDTLPRLRMNKNKNFPDLSTDIDGTLKAYLENGKKLDDIYEKSGQLNKVQRLREVRIRARKTKEDANITPQGMFKIPEGSADQVITIQDASDYINLGQALEGRLPGISIESVQGYSTIKLIGSTLGGNVVQLIVDGRKITTADEVSEILEGSILPEDVAKIEMARTNQAMVSVLGGPSILILTKLGTARKQYNPSVINFSPKGFNKVREFYSPKYGASGNDDKLPDLRSTVYWNPNLKTDVNGQTSFSFFNADGPGSYAVVIEGINAAGELGRKVYNYTVK